MRLTPTRNIPKAYVDLLLRLSTQEETDADIACTLIGSDGKGYSNYNWLVLRVLFIFYCPYMRLIQS